MYRRWRASFIFTHAFFLSEKGFNNWNKDNSDKQELISVNFTKKLGLVSGGGTKTDCLWQQVERKFTPNQGNYTTLVIYAESGGAFFDDVEVYEECESYKYIQNKYYDNVFYGLNAINGSSNFGEKAGINLYAGKNIDNSKPFGDVIMEFNSKVNYTASNEIILADGFWVQLSADFTAKILPCPNNFNKTIDNTDINPDPNYIILPPLLSDEESEKLKENKKMTN